MDAPEIAVFASILVAWAAVLGLVGPVFLRQGRVEGELKATRERSDDQFGWARDRTDAQYKELREWAEGQFKQARERSDAQYKELREWAEGQFKQARERSDAQHKELLERSDAQHAETLVEIRRLTDALVAHSHTDGGIIFHIPPPSIPPRQE